MKSKHAMPKKISGKKGAKKMSPRQMAKAGMKKSSKRY
jgi:hypothetical protein